LPAGFFNTIDPERTFALSFGNDVSMAVRDQITTPRLVLRPFSWRDADALFEYASDADYARYQSGPPDFNRAASDRFLAELMLRDPESRPAWGITVEDRVVGIVTLSFEGEHRVVVLGYGLHKDLWGQGLAREAVVAALNAAFAEYEQLQRVRAQTDLRNTRSRRLLTQLGFMHEGTLRSEPGRGGELVDGAIYGLLRAEWSG
jgi:[ribosomal protein S5]-alanine N-acetyltransferase